MTPDPLAPLLKQLDSEIRYREAHGLRDRDTALFRDCRLALQQAAQDVQMGHARLNECAGWEATKDLSLYDRISKKIEELVYAKSEVEHLLAATGYEKDALQAKAEAAEHRRAAAEYRATRIELDKELQGQLKAAKSHVAALTAEIAQLKQRYAEYGATEDDLAPFRQIAALTAQIQALREGLAELQKAVTRHQENDSDTAYYDAKDVCSAAARYLALLGATPAPPVAVYGSEVLCDACAKVFCPHGEPLHFHHDGCPACADVAATPAQTGEQ